MKCCTNILTSREKKRINCFISISNNSLNHLMLSCVTNMICSAATFPPQNQSFVTKTIFQLVSVGKGVVGQVSAL